MDWLVPDSMSAEDDGPDAALAPAILDRLSSGVLAFDRQLRLCLVNPRARALLGLQEAGPGDALAAFLPAPALAECSAALSRTTDESVARVLLPGARTLRWRTRRLGPGHWFAAFDEARGSGERSDDDATHRDPLTGLGDRRAFTAIIDAALAPGAALLMLDLDRFKQVNDSLGHPVGDGVLRLVGQRIAGAIRAEDAAFRLGGDEFAILLHDGAGAVALAERLVDLVSRPYLVRGVVATIGVSIGIARHPADGADQDALARCADMALYAAKADGRGLVRAFHPDMAARADARRLLEQDLRSALARGQMELFYQPQANLVTRRLVGFEALIRWRHPERGLVPPNDFIPLAEETRLILPIGEWVLRTACRDASLWPEKLPVAVNVSPLQLAEPERLVRAVQAALRASGIAPARLELEITETALIADPEQTLRTLTALRAAGVRIAMDDFGTGYSSLSQLRSFPFDKLKIDRSFVSDLGGSAEAVAVVRAIAALGTSLGMRTTAEGVETSDQADQLLAEGCTDMQGYLLSRPMPAGDVVAMIEEATRTA